MEAIVKIEDGELKGIRLTSYHGKTFYSFLGIPYAEPTVGNLRFKYPIPVKPWSGVRDATKVGNESPQLNVINNTYIGRDDCLNINVHTPQLKTKNSKPLPVLIKIHGGAFAFGSNDPSHFGADYIVENDTILVFMNYRLGILGFLCTDPINARGDTGLMDQNLALRWVKKNIAAFNGDPDNLTLFGISAGGISVEYHVLSPLSKNLFNRAIIQSGSVLNPWSRSKNPLEITMRLAKAIGYKSDKNDGLFEYINSIETEALIRASDNLISDEDYKVGTMFAFPPVVNYFKDGKGFLNEEPAEIFKSGRFNKVPIISGITDKEGMMMGIFYKTELFNQMLNNCEFMPLIQTWLNKDVKNLDGRLKDLYKKRKDDRNFNDNVIDFFSDKDFNSGIFFALDQRLIHNPNVEYFYCFTYDGHMNEAKREFGLKEIGACHADDWGYLGKTEVDSSGICTKSDWMVKNRMVKMWTNFAKTGNPTPKLNDIIKVKWQPITKDKFQYLIIGNELEMSNTLIPERRELWKELYCTI